MQINSSGKRQIPWKLIDKHLETDGVPICLGTAATDLGIETAAGKRRCAASQWKRIWKGRRRAKRVNRLCKMNSEAQKLTMTGIHPVQICGHTAQGASNAQVDTMCRNLKLGTVLGKTQACSITTVAWFFGVKRVPQTAARVEQISEWISMWRNCNVDTRRRIRRFWRKKAPVLAGTPRRWNQATGLISATICSVLEAGWKPSSPGFWQSLDGSATLDGAFFNKAQIIDSFSSDMEMQTWKAAARHFSSSGLEKGIITDFAKKARSQLIKEGNFTAARALDFLVCGAIDEPHLPADGSVPNQFLCVRCDQKVLATKKHELWEGAGNTLINHTHMKESEHLTSLAQEFWDTDQVLFARGLLPRDWLPASVPSECNEVKMWESVDFSACAKKTCVVRLGRIRGKSEDSPNTETSQQETHTTFLTILAHATKCPANTMRKNYCIALPWVIGTFSAHTVTRSITLCLFLLSRNSISHTLINVTPFLELSSRVAKVIMFHETAWLWHGG